MSHAKFDPLKHKRGAGGKFTDMLRNLNPGSAVELPDGIHVKVSNERYGAGRRRMYVVQGPRGEKLGNAHLEAQTAAGVALNKSAQHEHPDAVGGNKRHETYAAAMDYGEHGTQQSPIRKAEQAAGSAHARVANNAAELRRAYPANPREALRKAKAERDRGQLPRFQANALIAHIQAEIAIQKREGRQSKAKSDAQDWGVEEKMLGGFGNYQDGYHEEKRFVAVGPDKPGGTVHKTREEAEADIAKRKERHTAVEKARGDRKRDVAGDPNKPKASDLKPGVTKLTHSQHGEMLYMGRNATNHHTARKVSDGEGGKKHIIRLKEIQIGSASERGEQQSMGVGKEESAKPASAKPKKGQVKPEDVTPQKLGNVLKAAGLQRSKPAPAGMVRGWRPMETGFEVQNKPGGKIQLSWTVGGIHKAEAAEKRTKDNLDRMAKALDDAGIPYERTDAGLFVQGGAKHIDKLKSDLRGVKSEREFTRKALERVREQRAAFHRKNPGANLQQFNRDEARYKNAMANLGLREMNLEDALKGADEPNAESMRETGVKRVMARLKAGEGIKQNDPDADFVAEAVKRMTPEVPAKPAKVEGARKLKVKPPKYGDPDVNLQIKPMENPIYKGEGHGAFEVFDADGNKLGEVRTMTAHKDGPKIGMGGVVAYRRDVIKWGIEKDGHPSSDSRDSRKAAIEQLLKRKVQLAEAEERFRAMSADELEKAYSMALKQGNQWYQVMKRILREKGR